MDQELIAYLDERFRQVDERFREVNERMDSRFEQVGKEINTLDGAIRGNGVEIEGLRGVIQKVAEGVAAGNERLESFRTEVSEKFDEMGKLFNASHSQLHRRVSALEAWREKVERRP